MAFRLSIFLFSFIFVSFSYAACQEFRVETAINDKWVTDSFPTRQEACTAAIVDHNTFATKANGIYSGGVVIANSYTASFPNDIVPDVRGMYCFVVLTRAHDGGYSPHIDRIWSNNEPECSSKTLTLTPAPNQKDPRPKGTETKDSKSTYELIATVMEGSAPKAGVAVTFGVEPIANSGGHDHHDASRPKGLVNGALTASGLTDGNGEIKVTFQASQIAGTHVVAAVCSSCTNTSVTKNVDVKVPDLVSLQAGRGYTLEGNTSDVGRNHLGNHYFTAAALSNLQKIIDHFNSFGWQPVGINDASLVWGGKFDSKGYWESGFHDEHRIGEEVDIGFITGANASKITKGYYEICREKKVDIPSTILWHDIPTNQGGKYAPHFHVRLSGTYTKEPRTGKYAKCDSDSKTK